jgi:sulfatase modifying factor 1
VMAIVEAGRKWRWMASALVGATGSVAACSGTSGSALCSGAGCSADGGGGSAGGGGGSGSGDGTAGGIDAGGAGGHVDAGDAGVTGCPSGRGPKMVKLPTADGGAFCIDSTDVTNEQYAGFLANKNGDTSGQTSDCAWNSSFQPTPPDAGHIDCLYDPTGRANYPVMCVNWCDASAYCTWAGRRLCNAIDEWIPACTSGGRYPWLYGPSRIAGACDDNGDGGILPVASLSSCQSPDPHYSGVYDLLGQTGEWVSDCIVAARLGAPGACVVVGIGPCDRGRGNELWESADLVSRGLGFRCCASF